MVASVVDVPVARPTGSSGRRGDIQGLRALAVVLVVVYHTGVGLPGGYVGVDVFFVISGYVITRLLRRELAEHDRLSFRTFYLRRVRRILPPLAVMLSIVMVLSIFLAPFGGQQTTAGTGVAAALLNANTYLIRWGGGGYFDVNASTNALLHTWSLSVEEQFYIVFPALLALAWWASRGLRFLNRNRSLLVLLVAVVVGSFSLSWMLSTGNVGPIPLNDLADEVAFFSSVTRAWEFAVGALLAVVGHRRFVSSRSAAMTVGGVGLLLIAWAAVEFDDTIPFPGTAALFPVVGTAMLIAAGERSGSNPVSAALSVPIVQRIGDLSYSWYLWHWPMIVFAVAWWPGSTAVAVAAGLLSLIPAVISFRYVENPIRFRPSPSTARTVMLGVACVTVPVVAGLALEVGHRIILSIPGVEAQNTAFALHAEVERGCDSSIPLGKRTGSACVWAVPDAQGTAVLVGDSNAGHFTEGFTDGANSIGLDAIVATKSACPFVDVLVTDRGDQLMACRNFVEQTTADLIAMRPELVVIASASDTYVQSSRFIFDDPKSGQTAKTPDAKALLWEEGIRRAVTSLQDAGISVVVVHPVPKFPDWDPDECAALKWILGDGEACSISADRQEIDAYRSRAIAAEAAGIADTGATAIDFYNDLCDPTKCLALVDGRWRWRDGGHITVEMSEQLSDRFADVLRSASQG